MWEVETKYTVGDARPDWVRGMMPCQHDNRKEMRVKNCVSSFIAFTLLFLVVTTLAMKG